MPLAFLLALLLSTHPTWSRQLERTVDCPAGVELVTIKDYFSLDLYGYPASFDVERNILEASFEEVYGDMSTCEVNIEASILTNAVGGFDDVNVVEKQFSNVMTASMEWCRPTSCNHVSSIFHRSSTRRELRRAEECDCERPTQEVFLGQWQEKDTSGYRIIDLLDVVWETGCSSTLVQHYDTSVLVMLETQWQFWTDQMLNQVGGLVMETYNQLNTQNTQLCDPRGRQLVVAETQLFDFQDTMATLDVTLSGYCLDCTGIPLFDVDLGGRRASSEISLDISCQCSETPNVIRGPTLDEFTQEFGQAVAQLVFVQSLSSVEEQVAVCDVPQPDEDFQITVDVEFRVLCESLDDDVPLLPTHLVETYNAMVENDFCDPRLQTLDDATVVSTETRTNYDWVLVSFDLQGNCQGCSKNSQNLLFSHEASDRNLLWSDFNPQQMHQRSLRRCDCSDNALLNRPPTELEFLEAFNEAIEKVSDEFTCIVSVKGFESIETLAPTPEPSGVAPTPVPSVELCNGSLETTSTSTISVDVETDQTMSGERLSDLGQLVLQAYNALINSLYSECDSEYRLMTNASIFCQTETSARGKDNITKMLYEISGKCSGCGDGDYFDPDVLSRDIFLSYLSNTTDMTNHDLTMISIQEVAEMECSMGASISLGFVMMWSLLLIVLVG